MKKLSIAFCLLATACFAATSTNWEITGFSDFLKGRFSGLSLSVNGVLQPGPSVQFESPLNEPALWSMAAAPDHSVYVSSGHQGKVFRLGADGKSSLVWRSTEPEIFAICFDSQGRLYAGTSPNGALYRIENGKATQVWRSPVKYIWSLQPSPDGSLYVATGEKGQIFLVHPDGKAALYYDTGQVNVTALALRPNGRLLAGTEPNGLLYEISDQGKATILYDSSLPEIRAIAVHPNGTVYAAAMGGAVSTRTASAAAASTATPTVVTASTPTVITVTEAAQSGVAQPAAAGDQPGTTPPSTQTQTGSSTSSAANPSAANAAVVEVSGVEKSAIYEITSDRNVQTIRSSKEDNVYDLQLDGDAILFSTDIRGRIFRLAGRQTTLLAELADGETTRLLKSGETLYAAMSNPGRLFALNPAGAGRASYESQVHDSTSVARWGHLQWRGAGSGVRFRTRTGYSARPDATWSEWSDPITQSGASLIKSPPARFIQWKAEWPSGATAQIDSVSVPYLPQNGAPAVHSITVTSIVSSNTAKSAANTASNTSAYSITVTDTGEAPAASTATTSSQNVSRLQTTQTQISWQADDPDGDKLAYSVYFRAEDEKEWQLVRSRMFENTLLLDPDVFADGRYFFRVVASDSPSNPVEFAREAELVSTPVLIDNTPPIVSVGAPHRDGTTLDVDVQGEDKTSSLRLCEYSLDAGSWQPIEAVDGITDSPREQFHLHLEKLRPGEHLLVFRIYDTANNAGLARLILR